MLRVLRPRIRPRCCGTTTTWLHQHYLSTLSPRLFFKGEYTIVNDPTQDSKGPLQRLVEEARTLSTMDEGRTGFVGIDTETKPSRDRHDYHPTALLQLSTRSNCVMYHLAHLNGHLPNELLELLSNPHILKVGIGVTVRRFIFLFLHCCCCCCCLLFVVCCCVFCTKKEITK